jgi:hypothetical protein
MHSFRTHIRRWMRSIDMPVTPLRELFLRRYQALLILRGVSPHHSGCRQSAMEVLLNLSRHPARQNSYLRAIIRQIGRFACKILDTMDIPADDGTEWDVPGHVVGSGLRFSVIEDPLAAMPMQVDEVQLDDD